jgi:hypothetical protein
MRFTIVDGTSLTHLEELGAVSGRTRLGPRGRTVSSAVPYVSLVSAYAHDSRREDVSVSALPVVAGVIVLFAAYVCGRAAGILLDVNTYVTEVVAIALVAAAAAWAAARRGG